jgi:hypothetical protein
LDLKVGKELLQCVMPLADIVVPQVCRERERERERETRKEGRKE